MNSSPEIPSPDDSLRALFIGFDNIVEGMTPIMAFCDAAREHGPDDWRSEAEKAYSQVEFVVLFLGIMQRALTDLRLAMPEGKK